MKSREKDTFLKVNIVKGFEPKSVEIIDSLNENSETEEDF